MSICLHETWALFFITSSQLASWVGNDVGDLKFEPLSYWPYKEKHGTGRE